MYPNLESCVSACDVSKKGNGNFAADYVAWPKIARYLRKHAAGWQPFAKHAEDGGVAHAAPDGTCYLLIGFRHPKEGETVLVPHAVMDHKMNAKKAPNARDIADAYVRGMCKAAALLFGLGDKLWDKDDPFERDAEPVSKSQPAPQRTESKPEPFKDPEEADRVMGNCVTEDELTRWWYRVVASKFPEEERKALAESAGQHKAKLQEAG